MGGDGGCVSNDNVTKKRKYKFGATEYDSFKKLPYIFLCTSIQLTSSLEFRIFAMDIIYTYPE